MKYVLCNGAPWTPVLLQITQLQPHNIHTYIYIHIFIRHSFVFGSLLAETMQYLFLPIQIMMSMK